jgi:hypothetical protein
VFGKLIAAILLIAPLAAPFASAATIAVIFYDDRFGTLDNTTGDFTQVGTLPVSASSGIANDNGTLYVENMGSDLYAVNPINGAAQLMGPTGLTTTAGAFAGANNGLFGVDYSSDLFSINPSTGAGTLIGATGIGPNNGHYDTSLADDGSSLLYTVGAPGQADELYRINVKTGVATDLGSTGVTGIAGSAFVNGSFVLYQYGQSTNYVYSAPDGSLDFVRGPVLGAQIVDGGAVEGFTSSTLSGEIDSTPEPASWSLMLCGGLLACTGILWRRSPGKRAASRGAGGETAMAECSGGPVRR